MKWCRHTVVSIECRTCNIVCEIPSFAAFPSCMPLSSPRRSRFRSPAASEIESLARSPAALPYLELRQPAHTTAGPSLRTPRRNLSTEPHAEEPVLHVGLWM